MRGLLFYIHSSIHPIMGRHECHYLPESVLGTGDRTFCVTGFLPSGGFLSGEGDRKI